MRASRLSRPSRASRLSCAIVKTLRRLDISCALVTTTSGAPVGVVSLSDLARASKLESVHHGPLVILPPGRRAKDIVTTPIVSVDADADLSEAASNMLERRVHRVFTQMEAIRARALTPSQRLRPVEEIMSYETINLDADTPLYRAAGHAIATKVRRIPTVDGKNLAGIVTGYDRAHVLAAR